MLIEQIQQRLPSQLVARERNDAASRRRVADGDLAMILAIEGGDRGVDVALTENETALPFDDFYVRIVAPMVRALEQ